MEPGIQTILAAMQTMETRIMIKMTALEEKFSVMERSIRQTSIEGNNGPFESAGRTPAREYQRSATRNDSSPPIQHGSHAAGVQAGSELTSLLPSPVQEDIFQSDQGQIGAVVQHATRKQSSITSVCEPGSSLASSSTPHSTTRQDQNCLDSNAVPPRYFDHSPSFSRSLSGPTAAHARATEPMSPISLPHNTPPLSRTPPSTLEPRRREATESRGDIRPKKRRRLQAYVLVDPPNPNWVIQDAHQAILNIYTRNHAHDEDNASDDGVDDLSDLTELSTSDDGDDGPESDDEVEHALLAQDGRDDDSNDSDEREEQWIQSQEGPDSALMGASLSSNRVATSAHVVAPDFQKNGSSAGLSFIQAGNSRQASLQVGGHPAVSRRTKEYEAVSSSITQPQEQTKRSRSSAKEQTIKIKCGRHTIGREAIRERLSGANGFPVTLEQRIRSVTVDRSFMTSTFGGGTMRLYSDIPLSTRRDKGNHHYHFLFPNPIHNPEVPKRPGQAGLLCRALDYIEWDGLVVKLLVHLNGRAYLYLGDYSSTEVRPLSIAEFKALPERSRRAWVKDVKVKSKFRKLRAKIALRKRLQREPTVADIELESAPKTKIPLDIDDIVNAFSNGHEFIHIWRLECVGYDEDFQRRLAREYPRFLEASQKPVE